MKARGLSAAKRRLLDILKRGGPATAGAVAKELGLTVVAIRQHFQVLEDEGLVIQSRNPPQGRGRPSTLWSLTAKAEALFPDRHGELTVGLIQAAREAFGEKGLDRLIEARSRAQLEAYSSHQAARGSLGERLAALAEQRSAEGYMAEVVEDEPGTFLLIEHHCPICEAASACSGICRAELELFRRVLGDNIEVERTTHLLGDGDRCVYRVREAS